MGPKPYLQVLQNSNLSSLNGHSESNNNYSIKEEECDSEGDGSSSDCSVPRSDHPKSNEEPVKEVETKVSQASSLKDLGMKTSSLVLEKCSLSALVSKEDEEFCELYMEDFDLETEGEGRVDKPPDVPLKPEVLLEDGTVLDSEEEEDLAMQHPELPMKTLGIFIMCVYVYLILPLPHYQTQQSFQAPDPQLQQQQKQCGGDHDIAKAKGAGGQCVAEDAARLQCVHGQVCAPGKPKSPQEPHAECGKQPHCWGKCCQEKQEAWVNALLGRIFWDFLGEKCWSDLVSEKIQTKLSKIKLLYFMNELSPTELDMGVAVPKILQAFKPYVDHQGVSAGQNESQLWTSTPQGLWIDLEMSYNGSFLMTLETKMNLAKLGKEPLVEALKVGEIGKESCRPWVYCLADSDEESSSAGSSDEDDAPEPSAGDQQLFPGAKGAKPFRSLVKSLSIEVEPKETPYPPRHRHLMKTLVKSLSTDTSRQESDTVFYKPADSKLNLHLFKQFTQPRNTGGDSKTAPSSPLTSPSDTRSFFKVPEMEAKIEDTKGCLSEVIYEPFQLLSKIIGEERISHGPKALSSSASELSNLSSLNGHLESNNNYSIKEEECDSEGDGSSSDSNVPRSDHPKSTEQPMKEVETKVSQASSLKDLGMKTSSLVLEKCSLSALVSKEDEEFCELYTQDFDLETEGEGRVDKPPNVPLRPEVLMEDGTILDSEEEEDLATQHPELPMKTLGFFITCVYAYLILPLPHYVSGLCLGVGLGFMTAVCMIWFFTPPSAHKYHKSHKHLQHWNMRSLDIKEPEILKGWMNEIYNYDPETYHATLTHSIFVRLEGGTLRLSKPNKNISRRASYNEMKPDVTYISQKIYDLSDSKIYLVPESLARKRIWNKKYPICIELSRQDFMSKAQTDKETSEEKPPAERELGSEDPKKPPHPQEGMKSVHRDQILYLFGRTGREKEEWFRRFILASKLKSDLKKPPGVSGSKPGPLPTHSGHSSPSGHLTHSHSSSKGSVEEIMTQPKQKELVGSVRQKMLLDYSVYMGRREVLVRSGVKENPDETQQNKGLWIDLEMSYNGSFLMTLETKMNLTKLGKEPLVEARKVGEIGKEGCRLRAYCLADSDEESSSAGSSDEDDTPDTSAGDKQLLPGAEGYVGGHRTSKIMRFVDKITKSKYFQKATETEFIKKKIEKVSNTPLLLTVEVQECRGTLTVNIPPPPTDRIWYGFRKPPHAELKACPKLGEREVTLVHVTDWIEKKLEQEFQKVFVMPNMDNVYIPIMHSATDPRSTSCLLKDPPVEAADPL
ncbi:Testis-expressed sequence 2 protein [Heterocephalus glaber]|uniref:Testis-expressed sequence 2 protein n=1 Tax=Heterocephalus glaber TaxID=10181 RepID=G5BNC8_HETGA|nr:Testis-expressed sequence 2 protein [Heterocephalus glaber]